MSRGSTNLGWVDEDRLDLASAARRGICIRRPRARSHGPDNRERDPVHTETRLKLGQKLGGRLKTSSELALLAGARGCAGRGAAKMVSLKARASDAREL